MIIIDTNRLNFHWANLIIYGAKDHGWISAKQAWFMRMKDDKEKADWDKFMAEEAKRFDAEIALTKAGGIPWVNKDGAIEKRFSKYSSIHP
jgi:hypothetical protein